MNRFDDVPTDPDTRIRSKTVVDIAGVPALHQKWVWDGIVAESCIFAAEDVSTMDDGELKRLVATSPFWDKESSFTLKHGEKYVFVNFNFEY